MHHIKSQSIGKKGTKHFRMVFQRNNGELVSPINDIPLYYPDYKYIVNMVVEIPRGKRAKMEIATHEKLNPIKHDIKNGEIRYIHYPYPFNYGALPQTFEDPKCINALANVGGDNDPIDACDIGGVPVKIGEIIQVKVLGIWGMIDQGTEMDWKILCINTADPMHHLLNSIADVEKYIPGVIPYSFNFLKHYKIPSGAQPGTFLFDGELKDADFAMTVIAETHEQWKNWSEYK